MFSSGGLLYLDIRTGKVVKNLIERLSEGVFTVICNFSKVNTSKVIQ